MKKIICTFLFVSILCIVIFKAPLLFSESTIKVIKKPAPGTAYHAILSSVKLIQAGDYDKWINEYCHPSKLCYNNNSIKALKKYNLPALKRFTSECLKDNGTTLHVTRIDGNPDKDSSVVIFLNCTPGKRARGFYMNKDKGWKFIRI